MADEHLTDLSNQLARFAGNLDSEFVEKIRGIEDSLRWLFTRLKHCANSDEMVRYLKAALQISSEIDALCNSSAVGGHERTKEIVQSIGSTLTPILCRVTR